MTDEDLMRVYDEEMRLYRAYSALLSDGTAKARDVETAREEWLRVYRPLRKALPPAKLRDLLAARVAGAAKTRKGR